MANIGKACINTREWVDLETVIDDLTLTEDTAYAIGFEGKGYIVNAASTPDEDVNAGFFINNEKFGYKHSSGKLFVKNTEDYGLVINIAE